MLIYILMVLMVSISMFIGFTVGAHVYANKVTGNMAFGHMYVNEDDPNFATCGIEMEDDINTVMNKKLVCLIVVPCAYKKTQD